MSARRTLGDLLGATTPFSDWRHVRLKFTVNGAVGGHWGAEPVGDDTDIVCLRVADFDFERGGLKTHEFTHRSLDASERNGRQLREGDLLLEKSGGGDRQPVGRVVRVDRSLNRPAVSSNFVARLRPRPGFDSRYLCYLHRALYARGSTRTAIKQTTGIQNLDVNYYLGTWVPLPPGDEQRRIADFLDAELDILASSETRVRRLRGLIGERVVASSSYRLHCDRLLHAGSGLPADWRLIRLKFLVRLQSGVTLGKSYPDSDLVERPYLRVANVQDGRLDLAGVSTIAIPESDSSRYELRPGDVLMTEGGDNDKLGRGTVWDGEILGCLHQNHVFAVRPDRTRLRPEFLARVMASTHGKAYFQSTAHQATNLASTNSAKLMNFQIPIPPSEEQDRLLHEGRAERDSAVRLDVLLRNQLSLLSERRDALITAAVTGQLDPTSYRKSTVAA